MQIFINDTPITCNGDSSLEKILTTEGLPLINVAVAIDDTIIPKVQWATTYLQDGSRIIIIKAVQGG